MLSRTFILASALCVLGLSATTAAELRKGPKAVLELFTSQGCSSCPAADALLDKLSQRSDIVALAYHVDYWDYIGWPDTFGAKANSDHQRDYAEGFGSSRIFTPQLVVNGRGSVVASREGEVDAALASAALPVTVDLAVGKDGMLEISVPPADGNREAVMWLVTFVDRAEVEIERGENKGKTVAYTQIVANRQVLGMWESATGAEMRMPIAELLDAPANGIAVLIQEERNGLPGPILGAASYVQ
jgi:hypothetical protein